MHYVTLISARLSAVSFGLIACDSLILVQFSVQYQKGDRQTIYCYKGFNINITVRKVEGRHY
jgi:hypothetical protein